MNLARKWLDTLRDRRLLVAAFVGVVWALAFPHAGLAGLAWLVPGGLILCVLGAGTGSAFRAGYAAGFFQSVVSLYWLLHIPVNKFFPCLGLIALSAYLALYPAVWTWLCVKTFPELWPTGTFKQGADTLLNTGRIQRGLWFLACGVVWVALEFLRAYLITGFPWNLLGVSQVDMLPLIQIVSVTGVYGLSFLIVWFSVSLAVTVLHLFFRPAERKLMAGDLMVPALVISLVWGWGAVQILKGTAESKERPLKVAMVQPSFPQSLIWDSSSNTNRFEKLLKLTELALATKPDLLLWPEAAVPELIRYDEATFRAITNLTVSHKVWTVLCADDAEPRAQTLDPNDADYFNSSFLISPQGKLVARYAKRHLVMFGEYVPLANMLPFLKLFTPISGGFTPGEKVVPFVFPAPGTTSTNQIKTAVLICFEDVFPNLARDSVNDELAFLVNLTNDGWFNDSAAQWQHANNSVFRAVENRRPLIRCTNNGLTCWVDVFGRKHEVYFGDSADVYGAGFKLAEIPWTENQRFQETFYHRHGDWLAWGCAILAVLMASMTLKRKP